MPGFTAFFTTNSISRSSNEMLSVYKVLVIVLIIWTVSCALATFYPNDTMTLQPTAYSWHYYSKFLLDYHTQSPFRRMSLIFAMPVDSGPSESNSDGRQRLLLSRLMALHLEVAKNLSVAFSARGVSVNSATLPDADYRYLNISALAGLRENPGTAALPSVTVVLFSPSRYHTKIIYEVGGFTDTRLSWIVMSSNSSWNAEFVSLAMPSLRLDSRLLVVTFGSHGNAAVKQWNGVEFAPTRVWTLRNTFHFWRNATAHKGNILDLQKRQLSVAVFQDPPFTFITADGEARGWFVEIWKEIEEQLNFRSRYYVPSGSGIASLFRQAVEELRERRADVVLAPFALTEQDLETCVFSAPLATIRYRFYVRRSTTTSRTAQFLRVLTRRLWFTTLVVLLIASLLMTTAYLLGRRYRIELDGNTSPPIFNINESLLIIFGSLLQQGSEYSPEGLGSRMILWISHIFGVVIYTAYAAALISKLTLRNVDAPFTSLDGMLASRYTPYLIPDSAPHRLISSAENGAWRDLRETRPRYVMDYGVNKLLNRMAYSTERLTLLASKERVGARVQSGPLNCQLAQLPQDILTVAGRLLLQKKSPYKRAIDQQLLHMVTSGRLSRYRERWLALIEDDPCPKDSSLPQITLDNVALPFCILFFGSLLALLLLLTEVCWVRWRRKKNYNRKVATVSPSIIKPFTL